MANTSISTVSRALTGKPGVGAAKRDSIRDLAERLGYRPNQFARNLLSKKSHILGFVTSNLGNPTHTEFLRLMEPAARDRGYQILIADSRSNLDRERDNIEALLRNRVDGFVLFPVAYSNLGEDIAHLLTLHAQRVPFVVAGEIPGYYFDTVVSDDVDAGRRLARRLIELGHRRFGVVGASDLSRPGGKRREGVVEALRDAGLLKAGAAPEPPTLRAVNIAGAREGEWLETVIGWLRADQPPTALVCVNNPTALRLIRPLRDARRRVPRDVSLASFDDNVWCRHIETSMTTMSPRIDEVAKRLFEALLRRIENPLAPPVSHCVPQEFHERESTGPAPSAETSRGHK